MLNINTTFLLKNFFKKSNILFQFLKILRILSALVFYCMARMLVSFVPFCCKLLFNFSLEQCLLRGAQNNVKKPCALKFKESKILHVRLQTSLKPLKI